MTEFNVFVDAALRRGIVASVAAIIINVNTREQHTLERLVTIKKTDSDDVEFFAVIEAIRKLTDMRLEEHSITIYSDCLPIIQSINYLKEQGKQIKNYRINAYCTLICSMISKFESIEFRWISRKENKKAHDLCRRIIEVPLNIYKSKQIQLIQINDSIFLAQSSKGNCSYTVNLNLGTCTCGYFQLQRPSNATKCKHILAAMQYNLVKRK